MAASMRDIYKLLDDVDYHSRAITKIHTEVRSLLSTISVPEKPQLPCPKCGVACVSERTLAFHLQNVHDGPVVPLTAEEEAA